MAWACAPPPPSPPHPLTPTPNKEAMWGGRGRGCCLPLQGKSPPTPFRSGAYYARPALRLTNKAYRSSPHGRAQMITPFPKLRNDTFIRKDRPTACGGPAAALPGERTREAQHTSTFPAVMMNEPPMKPLRKTRPPFQGGRGVIRNKRLPAKPRRKPLRVLRRGRVDEKPCDARRPDSVSLCCINSRFPNLPIYLYIY
jgi:hypothetical protein